MLRVSMYLLACVCIYPLCEAVEARCEFCVQRANVIALLATLHQKKNISVAWAESVAMLTHKPINSSSSISGMQLKNTDTHTCAVNENTRRSATKWIMRSALNILTAHAVDTVGQSERNRYNGVHSATDTATQEQQQQQLQLQIQIHIRKHDIGAFEECSRAKERDATSVWSALSLH